MRVRFEGSVDEKGARTVGVFACVALDGIALQPIALFAIDPQQTTKEENPERVPPNEALWRIQGTWQGSASVGNLQGQKQPGAHVTEVAARTLRRCDVACLRI